MDRPTIMPSTCKILNRIINHLQTGVSIHEVNRTDLNLPPTVRQVLTDTN